MLEVPDGKTTVLIIAPEIMSELDADDRCYIDGYTVSLTGTTLAIVVRVKDGLIETIGIDALRAI